MRNIKIEKITLNIGAGTNQDTLKKGIKLLKNLTGVDAVKTFAKKRIPSWGLRPGLPIGCRITLRGKKAEALVRRLLLAKENKLGENNFDNNGNVSFGVHEYIDVPELNYDTSIGIMGFQVAITLTRPGYRIKERRKLRRKVGKNHKITKEDSIGFFTSKLGVKIEE